MKLLCTNFDYEFRLLGREGGLHGTRWVFEPLADGVDGSAEMRGGMQEAADFHRALLDRVFADVLKGARRPVLSSREDGSSTGSVVTSGWQYSGRLTWRGRRLLRRRLAHLFGDAAFPMGMRGPSCGETFFANIGLRFSDREPPSNLHLWVSHNLPPPVNASLFRHLLALEAFGFAPELTRKVERLNALLEAAAAGPDTDGYAPPPGLSHAGAARRRLPAGN